MVVQVLNNKLKEILKEKEILEGRNFAGLPKEETAALIHLLNCIIENTKENKNELWLLFQDMKKAFDLVSMKMLNKALRRIKIPEKTGSFIINLYENREIEVITTLGNTEKFVADDGIDQKEVISSLV